MSDAPASQAAPGPLARKTSPLSVPPPRSTRFGSPLVLSRVHWVEPKLVAEITYLTWTADNLLRHTVWARLSAQAHSPKP
jgi:ATP-dependent DNA ligase